MASVRPEPSIWPTLLPDLGADHRELGQGRIQELVLKIGPIAKEDPDHRREDHQQREQREEPVVGEGGRE